MVVRSHPTEQLQRRYNDEKNQNSGTKENCYRVHWVRISGHLVKFSLISSPLSSPHSPLNLQERGDLTGQKNSLEGRADMKWMGFSFEWGEKGETKWWEQGKKDQGLMESNCHGTPLENGGMMATKMAKKILTILQTLRKCHYKRLEGTWSYSTLLVYITLIILTLFTVCVFNVKN